MPAVRICCRGFIVVSPAPAAASRSRQDPAPVFRVQSRLEGKERRLGGTIDRRALLQRTRRSPIRPRRRSVEDSARIVAPAKADERET